MERAPSEAIVGGRLQRAQTTTVGILKLAVLLAWHCSG